MGYYAYKDVVFRIPKQFTAMIADYEGDPNYDGDAWTATSHWIDALEQQVKELTEEVARLRATPCPHVTRNPHGSQWCTLGQTTAEANRALAAVGAVWLWEKATGESHPRFLELVRAAADNPSTAARARELAQEVEHG